jgi:2-keto-4-pentenoate hydratase/2-oxohepta-3-ene-1,7-dioic acid hydratase in catechol pathway
MALFVRYHIASSTAFGILEGDVIRQILGSPFTAYEISGVTESLAEVKLLAPVEPSKIFCVGLNYRSHLQGRPQPKRPEMFLKPPTALQNPEDPIVIPKVAGNVHYEGELVIVIGRRAKGVSPEEAKKVIFGVTCGNDVSERDWQSGADKDLQWWRAKGSDTFAPLGPAIATGLNYNDLQLTTRHNGKVVQQQRTSDLIFDCEAIVSWVSQCVTLLPGDVIYTGTPGATSKISPGDVIEVELGCIGTLRNPVTA